MCSQAWTRRRQPRKPAPRSTHSAEGASATPDDRADRPAALASGEFGTIVWNSCIWTVFVVLFQNLFGFAVALLLDRQLPTSGLMRSLVLLPWVLPGVVAAILWRFMYDPQLGLINSFLIRIGLAGESEAWLADTGTAMP